MEPQKTDKKLLKQSYTAIETAYGFLCFTVDHGLFLPKEAKTNPSHSYAWINEDFTRILFSKKTPKRF